MTYAVASDKPAFVQEDLATPVQFLKGVGPSKAQVLEKVDVRTVEDLLLYFPREHQDRRVVLIHDAVPGQKMAFRCEVNAVDFLRSGKMLGQARARLSDGSAEFDAIWFKRLSFKYDVFSAVKRDVVPGRRILVYGAVEMGENGVELKVEDYEPSFAKATEGKEPERIVPVYPLTEGISNSWLRSLMSRVVPSSSAKMADPLPAALRQKQQLPEYAQALRSFHFPASWAERDKARERLAFDEFFLLELALAINRNERDQQPKGFSYGIHKNLLSPFRKKLGFDFTPAQTRVINEIFRDLQRPMPMNRLLQGDVGSGKTVVALSAALLAIENGLQVAFLAPTEILAEQHALSIARMFGNLPVATSLLTGSTPKPERKRILSNLRDQKIQLLIGTHAILNDDVSFQKLGLVIIDEQHRFGVRQRARLLAKAGQPDVLIMTATPIPRTLALTIYGDLDVSIIDGSPVGREPIKTFFSPETPALAQIEAELVQGRQAYVVFPLVEESESLSKKSGKIVQAATKEFERIQKRFPGYSVALLHGQMSSEEKKSAMDRFRSGAISVLVATPVIEVGIDVPNATRIAIYNPERFGLSQLHQLRGRVGRGPHSSACLLIHEADTVNEAGGDRLAIFCAVQDGFRLAEEDLKLRGPGEFIGEAQHGLPFFRVGDLIKDGLLVSRSREAARSLVAGELSLTLKEFAALNRVLQKRFGTKLQLSRVG